MTGADEASYLASRKLSSRLIPFPDGISRHITLEQKFWDTVDRLCAAEGWRLDDFTKPVLVLAEQRRVKWSESFTDFEDVLRQEFQGFIQATMPFLLGPKEWAIANEPFSPARSLTLLFNAAAEWPGE